MSSLRTVPVSAIASSVALIAYATLMPGSPTASPGAAQWQFASEIRPLTDACSNVALFVPFGVALLMCGARVATATTIGVLLSLAIEVLQASGHPTGRFATSADIIANGVGAFVGAAICASRAKWLRPSAANARRLAAAWTMLVALVVTGTAWLLAPERPGYSDRNPPQVSTLSNAPGYPWFAGEVVRTVVSGVPIPHRGSGPALVQSSSDTAGVVVRVRGRDGRHEFVPLVFMHRAGDEKPYLLIGQRGDDAVLRSLRRGDELGLRMPQLVIANAFGSSPSDSTAPLSSSRTASVMQDTTERELVAQVTSQMLAMRVASSPRTVEAQLLLTPAMGWLMVQPLVGDDDVSRVLGTTLWLFVLVGPACFWSWQCGRRRTSTTVAVLLAIAFAVALSATVFGIAPFPLWQWGTLSAAGFVGILLTRLTHPVKS